MAHEESTPKCSQPLETELSHFLESLKTPRDRLFIARYLGWDGFGGCNFQDIGTEFGFTRERVRQICGPILEMLASRRRAFTLDRTIAFIEAHANRRESEIEALLVARGFTSRPFRVEGILKTARLFGRMPGFEIEKIGSETFVTTEAHLAASVLTTARHLVTHWGALTTCDLAAAASTSGKKKIEEPFVRVLVSLQPDFRWLNEAAGWFWLTSAPRNRLVSRIGKVLCVSPRVSISELLEAVARDRSMRAISIPPDALLSLCAQLPWCRIDGGMVEAITPLDPARVLADAERRLLEILQTHGGSLPGGILERLFTGAGMTRANLWRMLADSPVIHPVNGEDGRRSYRIVGQKTVMGQHAGSALASFAAGTSHPTV